MDGPSMPTWHLLQCDGNLLCDERTFHTAVGYQDKILFYGGSKK
eukprot:gene14159-4154_t